MREPDPLDDILREEWKAPEPTPALDRRVTAAWRSTVRPSGWLQFWRLRFSIPAPVLVAAMLAVVALFLWLRRTTAPVRPGNIAGVQTSLNAGGFQPLSNGEARIIPATEVRK